MKLSDLIHKLTDMLNDYGDIPIVAHWESDFAPIEIVGVNEDNDDDYGVQFVEIILSDNDRV